MKGLPVVSDSILEDSVSLHFPSSAFKLHGRKVLDVIIKDLHYWKRCLFIPGIAHTKMLTRNVLPSLKSWFTDPIAVSSLFLQFLNETGWQNKIGII